MKIPLAFSSDLVFIFGSSRFQAEYRHEEQIIETSTMCDSYTFGFRTEAVCPNEAEKDLLSPTQGFKWKATGEKCHKDCNRRNTMETLPAFFTSVTFFVPFDL